MFSKSLFFILVTIWVLHCLFGILSVAVMLHENAERLYINGMLVGYSLFIGVFVVFKFIFMRYILKTKYYSIATSIFVLLAFLIWVINFYYYRSITIDVFWVVFAAMAYLFDVEEFQTFATENKIKFENAWLYSLPLAIVSILSFVLMFTLFLQSNDIKALSAKVGCLVLLILTEITQTGHLYVLGRKYW